MRLVFCETEKLGGSVDSPETGSLETGRTQESLNGERQGTQQWHDSLIEGVGQGLEIF